MTVPTQLDFAQEVRAERLSLLWKITLIIALFLVWGSLILTSLNATNPTDLFLPTLIVAAGCLACRQLLRVMRYTEAVWAYVIATMFAIAIMAHVTDVNDAGQAGRLMLLFIMPLIILLVGFLLPVRASIL